jgi:hypothetical protein
MSINTSKPPHLPLDVLTVIAGGYYHLFCRELKQVHDVVKLQPLPEFKDDDEWVKYGCKQSQKEEALIAASPDLIFYRLLLALPRFARSTLARTGGSANIRWQRHFTVYHNNSCTIYPSKGSYEHNNLVGIYHRIDGPAIIYPNGKQVWYYCGKIHRENGPAVVDSNGYEIYYQFGNKHRLDGPAVYHRNGTQYYYQVGRLHREDGPAVINEIGTQEWYVHNMLHRCGGPAVVERCEARYYEFNMRHRIDGPAVINENGKQEWYQFDKLHRDDGPAAITADGCQAYYRYGQLHRLDGPAMIRPDGREEYWIYDMETTKERVMGMM